MSGSRPVAAASLPEEIHQISHLLPALWRSATRATRAYRQMPALESQVSILRKVVDDEVATPAQLAEVLHLARPTVSNLLRDLEANGLVERHPSTADGRSVVVVATSYGRSVLEGFRQGRADVLAQALKSLSQADRNIIVAALPSLERFLVELDALGDTAVERQRAMAIVPAESVGETG